ncbi:MAG TPA: SDR family NAD(P)-dependent oxidoreductase [Candidatus Limnocylindria bacterium]|nr:SDR family NAD(P)-dependent oxidoreductase [Candidatus Limnocylindria bacterium]
MEGRKYVVITGASSGIGREAALAFAKRGRNLVLCARREDALESLKGEIAGIDPDLDVQLRVSDLSVPGSAERLYASLKPLRLECLINNAGFGDYHQVADADLEKLRTMLHLNVEALLVLSALFVKDYRDEPGAQLINVSSAGGYTIVPPAVTYCATKFFVGAFTEGLDRELQDAGSPMRAKVFAPAATQTEFGKVANDVSEYDYDAMFNRYLTAPQAAGYLMELFDNDATVGYVNRADFRFVLSAPRFDYAGNKAINQKMTR